MIYYSDTMAAHPLILTKEEQAFFLKLPGAVREGWVTEKETLPIKDNMRKLSIRIALMHLVDPRFKEFQEKVKTTKSEEEVATVLRDLDLENVDSHDMQEILFAMGPVLIGFLIEEYLKIAKDDNTVKTVAAMTIIRHSILEAQNESVSK